MSRFILAAVLALTPAAAIAQSAAMRQETVDSFAAGFVEYDASYSEARRVEARREIERLRSEAERLTDAQLALELARIAALADNGHSAVLVPGLAAPHELIGVRFLLADDGLLVADAQPEYAELVGARVERVEGRTLAQLREVWSRYSPGPDAHRDETLPILLETPALLHAAGVAADSMRVTLTLADGRTAAVGAAARWFGEEPHAVWRFLGESRALALARAGRIDAAPLYLREPEALFRVVPMPERDAVYVQFRANAGSVDGRDLGEAARSAIDSLRALRPRFVIVDQRMNGGGDLNKTRDLMQAIPAIVGDAGAVFAITSGRTFSAGISSVGYLKQAAGDRLTIVGAPVGDDLEFHAEGDLLVLPNGLYVLRSTERHNYMTGCPEADCHGPIRRHPIRIRTLEPDARPSFDYEDYVTGRDPYLEEVLARIDARRRPSS